MEDTDQRQQYDTLIDDFDHAMLVTHSNDGGLRARPMRIVAHRPDGTLVFVTHVDDEKVDEIANDSRVNVTLQSGHRFVSVTGSATLSSDAKRIGHYFNSSWQLWFPEGAKDPNILLVDVEPSRAEFWDTSGWKRVQYAAEALKAKLNDERIKTPDGTHANVAF